MKKIILSLMVVAALTACGNNKKADTNSAEATEKEQVVDMHNAENSLDYWGVYKGTLPAADCPGIETTLTINKDSTYLMHSSYIDRNVEFDEKGTYTLDGSMLGLKDGETGTVGYLRVEEGQVRWLDGDKQPITGDLAEHFILKQTEKF